MQPQNPDPKFDFMLKNNQQPKHGPVLPNMSKPVRIILGAVIGVILLIVLVSLLSGRSGGSTKQIVGALARGQEILRVTQEVQQQLHLQDPSTQGLAATVSSSLSSDQAQLKAYLASNKAQPSLADLAVDTDKNTDAQLQSASQNNSLDQAYVAYLQQNLAKYQADLQTAYKSAGPKGKALLKTAFDSSSTLLSAPPLKS